MESVNGNGSGGMAAPPAFTLRSLREIKLGQPKSYWWKYLKIEQKEGRDLLKRLKEGVRVKVLVQSVGHQKNPCEEIWLMIRHIERKAGKYVGEVFTDTDDAHNGPPRSIFHGLHQGMLIRFERKHILDIWLDDLV